jgi:hypothetical protein
MCAYWTPFIHGVLAAYGVSMLVMWLIIEREIRHIPHD